MKDDTIGPVITWTTEGMLSHVDKLLKIPGARLAFGGKELEGHTVPKVYGAIQPTAVFVPLKEILKDEETFKTVTTEVFGPLQVRIVYSFTAPPPPGGFSTPSPHPPPRHYLQVPAIIGHLSAALLRCCWGSCQQKVLTVLLYIVLFVCSFANDAYAVVMEMCT